MKFLRITTCSIVIAACLSFWTSTTFEAAPLQVTQNNVHSSETPSIRLTGYVKEITNNPLEGVHVIASETCATATDRQGMFDLQCDAEDLFSTLQLSQTTPLPVTLHIQSLGYQPEILQGTATYKPGSRTSDAGTWSFQWNSSRAITNANLLPNNSPTHKENRDAQPLFIQLRATQYKAGTVVVTATRTQKDLEEVTLPVSVITEREISNSGSTRISEILEEQTGLQLTSDFGTGIQIQGFDADYTLIMLDGEPLIGRIAGTLDLNRISVHDIRQIEIVKGPSSALWGSDALAGVINIITKKKTDPMAADLSVRYGKNNAADLGGTLHINREKASHRLFLNGNRSDGYKLNSTLTGQTVPEFRNGTASYRGTVQISDRLTSTTSLRYFREKLFSETVLQINETQQTEVRTDDTQDDISATQRFLWTPFDQVETSLSWYYSTFSSESILTQIESGEFFERLYFRQTYQKPELQTDIRWSSYHQSTVGFGLIGETLSSQRYPSDPQVSTRFAYAQQSWSPTPGILEFTAGLRFDHHSDYKAQLSPKFSARYRISDRLQVRASAGRGFKAPDFRQLFLDFTNSTAGYTVYGSSTVREGLQQQIERGLIAQIFLAPEQLSEIRAESSWALNSGFDLDITPDFRFRTNLFWNHVTDLIEIAPIARRTTGQSVFTYFNLDEVITRGGEAEIRVLLAESWTVLAGYQFLDARRLIETTKTVQDDEGELIQVTEKRFEPMFNRSAHTGNIRVFYQGIDGWKGALKGTFRGRYGLFDRNANGFADQDEYESASMIWDLSAGKTIRFQTPQTPELTLRTGIDNLLDYTDINQPFYAGRLWYVQLQVRL